MSAKKTARSPRWLQAATLLACLIGSACGARAPADAAKAANEDQAPAAAWLAREGEQAALRGDTVRAEQYLALAVERGYDQRRALPLLLAACIKGSRLRSALNHAEPYLRDHPDDYALRYLVATIDVSLGDEAAARRELEALLRDAPEHPGALYLLGTLEAERNPERAAQLFQRYIEQEPDGLHAADVEERLRDLDVEKALTAPRRRELAARGTKRSSP